MIAKNFLIFIVLCCVSLSIRAVINENTTFSEWRDSCFSLLPEYDRGLNYGEEWMPNVILESGEFKRALDSVVDVYVRDLSDSSLPVDFSLPSLPYAQKVVVEPGMNIYIQGDIHGSLHSLLRNLDRLKDKGYLNDDLSLNNINLFFLGDYGDRGRYSVEVLYTLARLKEKNPTKVFFARGNHEVVDMARRPHGLYDELKVKYAYKVDALFNGEILHFFDVLPRVIFLGSGTSEETNYVMLCHGIPMIGYDPRPFLDFHNHEQGVFYAQMRADAPIFNDHMVAIDEGFKDDLHSAFAKKGEALKFLKFVKSGEVAVFWDSPYIMNEFWWGDLKPQVSYNPMRLSLAFPPSLISPILGLYSDTEKNNYVKALFRGHQHGDSGNGVFDRYRERVAASGDKTFTFLHCKNPGEERLLKYGSIYTTISAPEGVGCEDEEDDYDSFVLLKTAEEFADWRVTPYEYQLPRGRTTEKSNVYFVGRYELFGSYVQKNENSYTWSLEHDYDGVDVSDLNLGDSKEFDDEHDGEDWLYGE